MEVIDVDSRSGGNTHIYISSDKEENAVYADDATSVAAVGNPSGASDTIIESAGESNGDDDAGGYSDDDDNHTEDHNDNVSSAFATAATHIYIGSDKEENAVYADDATSVAAVGNPAAHRTPSLKAPAGQWNADAGGYSDGDDNHTEDHNDNVSSAFASKSQRGPYSYWHERDICRLVEIDGLLSDGLNDLIVPSSTLYVEFVKNYQPVYRDNLDSKTISEKRYKLKKKFFDYCKSEASLNPGQEGPVYACCREAWPHIVEGPR
ncbi:hypothetical protein ZWY2020_016874 [Hordeum vulgare]|nr:hypothetical protein ZWY2020_016874 [Hordeum vulgare]